MTSKLEILEQSMYLMPGSNLLPYMSKTPRLSDGVFVASGSQLIGDLQVGADCGFWFNTVARADCNYIRIGERTNIQDGTVIHVTNKEHPTVIGSDVTIGHGAVIHGCTIGNLCLIGMGSIIMDGAEIGDQCIVAAGALVSPGKKYEPGTLIKGSPAKASRPLTEKEKEFLKISSNRYLEYKKHYVPNSSD